MNSSLNNSKSIDEIIIDIKSTVIVGEYETSLIELESAIVQYPDSAVLWELKASVLFSINMYKEAINSAHIANGLDSGLIDSWIIKAKSLYMLHKYDESYAHCIGQGYDLIHGTEQQKLAVQSGYWPLLRYDPRLHDIGKNPLQIDSSEPSTSLDKYIYNETRYRVLLYSNPDGAAKLLERASEDVKRRWGVLRRLAG